MVPHKKRQKYSIERDIEKEVKIALDDDIDPFKEE